MSGGGVEGEGETGGCGDMCSLAPKQDMETFTKVPVVFEEQRGSTAGCLLRKRF